MPAETFLMNHEGKSAKNEVVIEIHQHAYLERFISLNEMHVDIVDTFGQG